MNRTFQILEKIDDLRAQYDRRHERRFWLVSLSTLSTFEEGHRGRLSVQLYKDRLDDIGLGQYAEKIHPGQYLEPQVDDPEESDWTDEYFVYLSSKREAFELAKALAEHMNEGDLIDVWECSKGSDREYQVHAQYMFSQDDDSPMEKDFSKPSQFARTSNSIINRLFAGIDRMSGPNRIRPKR